MVLWFSVPTRVLNTNGISIGSAVFAGLTSVTDKPTDHITPSVTIDLIYVRSTAIRPNNNNISVTTFTIAMPITDYFSLLYSKKIRHYV